MAEDQQEEGEATVAEASQVKVTFTVSREAYERLKALADAKGASMADIFREALRRDVWLESVLGDETQDLLIRDKDRPDELQRVMSI